MTCIVGVKSLKGDVFLAADMAISWPLARLGFYRRDELLKIIGLSPEVALAFTSNDLLQLRSIIAATRNHFAERQHTGELQERLQERPGYAKRLLRWSLHTATKSIHGLGLHQMLIGAAGVLEDNRRTNELYFWSSTAPDSLKQIRPGEVCVLGSVQANLAKQLRDELRPLCSNELSSEYNVALFGDVLSRTFSGLNLASIGGLFSIVYSEDGEFVRSGYFATKIVRGETPRYAVALSIDEQTGRYVQIGPRGRVLVYSIEEVDLINPVGNLIFAWRR